MLQRAGRCFNGFFIQRGDASFRDNNRLGSAAVGASGNGPDIAHIGNSIEQQKERGGAFFHDKGNHVLEIMIGNQGSNGHTSLMISPGKAVQFFFGNRVYRNTLLQGEFTNSPDIVAARIPQYKDPFNGFAGTERLYNRLPTNDKSLLLIFQNRFRAKVKDLDKALCIVLRLLHMIKRAFYLRKAPVRDVSIYQRSFNVIMPEQPLDQGNVGAILQQMGGIAVTQAMNAN